MILRTLSVGNRLFAFTLLEVLAVLGVLAALISIIQLDAGTVMTRLADTDSETRVRTYLHDALFESVVIPTSPAKEIMIPGCSGSVVVFAGGYFSPTRITCADTTFDVQETGELSRVN